MLPKIHKPPSEWTIPNKMPKGRPIISDCNSISEKVAEYIDNHLKLKASQHPSYIKNTYDFIDKIKDVLIPPNSLLITLDVESMYTNILHEKGLESITERFKSSYLDENILELLELCLNSNDFEFYGKWFLQNSGTTMGTKWSPHYADIFMAYFEEKALEKCPHKPFIYLRYLDDIFIIWHHGRTVFSEFIDIFNSHQPPIRFKATIHEHSIDFLDTTIYKDPKYSNSLLTKVYFKPIDIHQLLDKTSFHPKHTFSGILKSQITRFYRICSEPSEFEKAWSILYEALSKRNYSKRWMRRIKFKTVLELKYKILDTELTKSSPGPSKAGSFKCGKSQCKTCKIIVECQNFTSQATKDTFSITSEINCDSENVIYLYTCNICQIQYIGETKNSLKERANAHRSQIMCKDSNHPLYKHLVSNPISHSIDTSITHDDTHFTLTPIELIKDFGEPLLNTFERLKRESYWMVLIGTIKPYGLNTNSVDFAPKYQPPFKKILPFVVPFSKTANLAAKIIKKHYKKLQNDDEFDVFDFDVITAYSRHKNIYDYLVHSKLC